MGIENREYYSIVVKDSHIPVIRSRRAKRQCQWNKKNWEAIDSSEHGNLPNALNPSNTMGGH
jgi:hypothetical protein